MLNNLQQLRLKLLQTGAAQKTAEETGGLIGNKIADKIAKVSKNSQPDNSEREKYW